MTPPFPAILPILSILSILFSVSFINHQPSTLNHCLFILPILSILSILLILVFAGRSEQFLGEEGTGEHWELLRRHEPTGRPLGGERFLPHLESLVDRVLRPQKRAPKSPWKHRRKN